MSEWVCVKERTPTSNESVMVGSFDNYGNNGIAKAWFANANWYLDCDGLRATDDHLSTWSKLAASVQDIQLDVAEQDYLNG